MMIQGTVIRYGDHIDTDVIIPARYLNTSEPAALAAHCMEDLDRRFSDLVKTHSVIVAGENFGCGSSREHAPIALKASGIQLVIAKSFARIFYRNAINIGLAIVECPEAASQIKENDRIEAELDHGVIRNLTNPAEFRTAPFPPFIQTIIANGGLIAAAKNGALMQNEIIFRRFQPEDAQPVSDVIAETLRTSNRKDYSAEQIEHLVASHTAEVMAARARECHSYVICDGQKVIGTGTIAGYWGSETESILLTVFILPEYQGRGLGRKLIETLEQDEYGRRASRIEIPASFTAVEFYRKCGYDYKNGIAEVDPEMPMYRLEKFPRREEAKE